jgi:hypothetical protein
VKLRMLIDRTAQSRAFGRIEIVLLADSSIMRVSICSVAALLLTTPVALAEVSRPSQTDCDAKKIGAKELAHRRAAHRHVFEHALAQSADRAFDR